jgi:hypothetical protein
MSTTSRTLVIAALAVLSADIASRAATRSTTFDVSAEVATGCSITHDDRSRATDVHVAAAAECSNQTPYNLARDAALPAPFAASQVVVPEDAAGRCVRITITF